jgi:hypothetical protein
MAYDPNAAGPAMRGEGVDGALEAVEEMGLTVGDDLERTLVVIVADFTLVHVVLHGATAIIHWVVEEGKPSFSCPSFGGRERGGWHD